MFDPVLFVSPLFENADGMVLFCKELLEKKGHIEDAQMLGGLAGINSPAMARAALRTLHTISTSDKELQEYLDATIDVLMRASGQRPLRAAS